MKAMILIPVAALSLYAMQVHAEDASTSSTSSDSNAAMTTDSVGGTTAGTTSGASAGKTRAQVYQELIRAKQDGTLDRINEFYGGGN
ncbi:conserved exported hypothetical protein [Paraburkholderia piptadeniae]|uniref:DUF4148 domain-containing protein n=1 Tax=Paraburkholderia piptadeniae TaxID=1701573 RepID=A0A1N7S061_9BURK|nr:DUF4148 domain-containing protein [Paraburkholderia piptadeniae]SIT40714.1 conserved exported hypothetical protein [Paraburkholderia piptadeniae]